MTNQVSSIMGQSKTNGVSGGAKVNDPMGHTSRMETGGTVG